MKKATQLLIVTAATLGLGFQSSKANPAGGIVTVGTAGISTTTGNVQINQSSQTAIINWNSFSIATGEKTQFIQPAVTSATLNRVTGGQTSLINGTLTANGQVYLVNGNGIMVGATGVIHAGAFTASTRDISDQDFLAGKLHFTGDNDAGVQNLGSINAIGGDVFLIGHTVDNQGTIRAASGTAGLAAGDDVLITQGGTEKVTIQPGLHPVTNNRKLTGVHNSGTIAAVSAELKAANGNVYALAINNEGVIRATTVAKQGGHIYLTSDNGKLVNSGKLNASAHTPGGKGGTILLKSVTGTTVHTGKILAQGGEKGEGGNAEISGGQIEFKGLVDLTAAHGTVGNLLLDPLTLEVITGGGSSLTGSTVDPAVIVAALKGANVTLQATQSIAVTSRMNAAGNASKGNLTLEAPLIDLNAPVLLKSGSLLTGTGLIVNVGANGLIQNGVDVAASGGTVNLAGAVYSLSNEVIIDKSLTVQGAGADSTILDGQNKTRVMEIDGSMAGIVVNLNGLALENGKCDISSPNSNGGGLFILSMNGNAATVTLTESAVVNNSAYDGGGIFSDGNNNGHTILTLRESTVTGNTAAWEVGGILSDSYSGHASLTIDQSTVSSNSAGHDIGGIGNIAYGGNGTLTISNSTVSGNSSPEIGGIYNDGYVGNAKLVINNSTIADNSSGDYPGGGIYNFGNYGTASVTITNSTISGNSTLSVGGGIYNYGYGGHAAITIANSTIADNSAAMGGGAIYNFGETGNASVTISNSTISGNSSKINGGGIYNDGSHQGEATLTINDTILAGNTIPGHESDYVSLSGTLVDLGYNLYGQNGGFNPGSGISTDLATSDITTVLQTDGNGKPLLADNGGPTPTVALVVGSPAYLAGGARGKVTTDQRGMRRGAVISIGAYDYVPGKLVVNSTADTAWDALGGAITTLRDALYYANLGVISNPTITFDSSIFATEQTISLTQGQLDIRSDLTIKGPGFKVILDAHQASRVMEIEGSEMGTVVNLSGLALKNGSAKDSSNGGGLLIDAEYGNSATVTLSNSVLSGNYAYFGGAIANDGFFNGNVNLTISNTTIMGNTSFAMGGAILNAANYDGYATLSISKSKISGNSAGTYGYGGAIQNNYGTMLISGSTISGNLAFNGGGIRNTSGILTITDSIIQGNTVLNVGGGSGGGIENDGNGRLTVTGTTFSGNIGAVGGAITNDGSNGGDALTTIINSTFSRNSSGCDGGAIYSYGHAGSATVHVIRSTFSGNTADEAGIGAILNQDSTMTIVDSTMTGNTLLHQGLGGVAAISNYGGNLTITGSTITGNSNRGGIGGIDNSGTLTISNTILSDNTGNGGESDYFAESHSTLNDQGYNLYGQNGSNGGFKGNGTTDIQLATAIGTVLQTDVNGKLLLANNGGPTQTIALVIGSVAIDAGSPALIGSEDQRGIMRGSPAIGTGLAADIGAYEAAIVKVNADGQEIVYGQALPELTYTVTSGPSDLLTGSVALLTPETDAGTYLGAISQGTLTVSSNSYLLDFNAGTLVIEKRPVTIDPNADQSKIYGSVNPALTYTTTPPTGTTGLINGDVLDGALSYTGAGQFADVGSYAITLGTLSNANYAISLGDNAPKFGITPAPLMVAALDESKTYGENISFSGAEFSSSGLLNGQTIGSVTLASEGAAALANVRSLPYVITASGATGGTFKPTNYAITYVNGAMTVNPAVVSVVALGGSSVYGDSPTNPGLSASGLQNGQGVNVLTGLSNSFAITATSSAGSYPLSVDGTLNNPNYALVNASFSNRQAVTDSQTWSVVPAPLTITAASLNKTYGQTITFTGTEFSSTGLQNGENIGSVTLTSAGTAPTAGVADSPYAIVASQAAGGTFDPHNYSITYIDGALKVFPAPLTVTALDESKTYGQGLIFSGTEFSSSGLQNHESIGSVSLASTGAIGTAGVAGSPYAITANQAQGGTFNPDNYAITYVNGALSVTPASLAIKAEDQNKTYGQTISFVGTEFSATGLQNGETVGSVALFSAGANRLANVAGSPYTISVRAVTGGTFDPGNYAITYIEGSLAVGRAALLVTANDEGKTYNGLAYAGGNGATYVGFVNGESVSVLGGSLDYSGTSQGAVNAGTYSIQPAGLVSGNYAITYASGSLAINPASVMVTALGGNSLYGASSLNPGISATGLQNGEDIRVLTGVSNSFGITPTTPVGNYALTVAGTLTNPNYVLVQKNSGAWIVDPVSLTVTANDAAKFLGSPLPPFSYTLTGELANGENASILGLDVAYMTEATMASPAGHYAIIPSGTFDDRNYQITFANGLLKVEGLTLAQAQLVSNFSAANNSSDYSRVTLHHRRVKDEGVKKPEGNYAGRRQAPPNSIAYGSSFDLGQSGR